MESNKGWYTQDWGGRENYDGGRDAFYTGEVRGKMLRSVWGRGYEVPGDIQGESVQEAAGHLIWGSEEKTEN